MLCRVATLQGRALRRLIYVANTRSIVGQLLSRETLAAAVAAAQAGSVMAVMSAMAGQIEEQLGKSVAAAQRAFRRGVERDIRARHDPPPPLRPSATHLLVLDTQSTRRLTVQLRVVKLLMVSQRFLRRFFGYILSHFND